MTVQCRFCGSPDPSHEYPLNHPLTVPCAVTGWPIRYGVSSWPVCAACAPSVDAGQWETLVDGSCTPDELLRKLELWAQFNRVHDGKKKLIRRSGALS